VKYFVLMLTILIFFQMPPYASANETEDAYTSDFKTADLLKAALKENNRAAVADLVFYPFEREYPLPPINSAADFLVNWDHYFDNSFIEAILKDAPSQIGWRGVQINNGMIWFKDGKVWKIHHRTERFQKMFSEVKSKEAANIHPTARGYSNLVVQCSTQTKLIRIQEHENLIRYYVWKKETDLSSAPELTLSGERIFDGSGGNSRFLFKNSAYTYELSLPVLCEESVCEKTLSVFQNNVEISSQACVDF